MTAQPLDVPPAIVVAEPTKEQVKAAEEKLAHYHPEHHHFYNPKKHMGKRMLRVVIAGTGVSAVHAMRRRPVGMASQAGLA